MALKPCIECKKDISSDADPCPHCGKKSPHGTSNIVKFGGGFLVLAVALPVVVNLFKDSPVKQASAIAAIPDPQHVAEQPVEEPAHQGIADGVYEAGKEFAPGIYRVGRYFERQDHNQGTIDNDLTSGCPTIMVVKPTDAYVKISGGAVDAMTTVVDPIKEQCTAGTFLVGHDIAPGRYKLVPTGDASYWERINKNMGTIDNDLGSGPRIVVVRPNDFALKINNGTLQAM